MSTHSKDSYGWVPDHHRGGSGEYLKMAWCRRDVIREEKDRLLPFSPPPPSPCASAGDLLSRPAPRGRSVTGWAGPVIAHVSGHQFLPADMISCPLRSSLHPSPRKMAPAGTAPSCVPSISRSIRLSVNNSSSQSGGKRLRPEAGRGRSNAPTPPTPGGAIAPPPNPPKGPSNIEGKREERKIKSGGREGR